MGSGEDVNGRLGFMRPLEGLAGGAEELFRGPLGGRAPTEAERQKESGGGGVTGEVNVPQISTSRQIHPYPTDHRLPVVPMAHASPSSFHSGESPSSKWHPFKMFKRLWQSCHHAPAGTYPPPRLPPKST